MACGPSTPSALPTLPFAECWRIESPERRQFQPQPPTRGTRRTTQRARRLVPVDEAVLQLGRGGDDDATNTCARGDAGRRLWSSVLCAGRSHRPGPITNHRPPPGERGQASAIVFDIGHPVADAGDDRSAGPIMELVLEFLARELHSTLPRRDVGGRARPTRSRRGLTCAVSSNSIPSNDGWRSNAIEVLGRLDKAQGN